MIDVKWKSLAFTNSPTREKKRQIASCDTFAIFYLLQFWILLSQEGNLLFVVGMVVVVVIVVVAFAALCLSTTTIIIITS